MVVFFNGFEVEANTVDLLPMDDDTTKETGIDCEGTISGTFEGKNPLYDFLKSIFPYGPYDDCSYYCNLPDVPQEKYVKRNKRFPSKHIDTRPKKGIYKMIRKPSHIT